ncbi:prolipoprotein diacylglyceryl transferase [Humisphaera borealis]|uniref:Prolipoprotein diacylglyceryl transferase n=1 Tax=Humisphaera borealis TaxID=2807512 RepID=A0A7M2WXF5_9BACT|nr:prolipoprotein diacylglyceryl transferase [Humisphaera borealis]QOV89491.1 prolipoprotein diacylglyceryl transferase [Humisphaera borealis]
MQQELFRLPFFDIPIYGYGLMLVVGFLGALTLARFLSIRSRIDPEIFVNCGIIALVSGIAGARLSHVLENWSTYTDPARSFGENLFAAINIRSGGLTFYGGFIFATVCCIGYGLIKKVPIRRGMDIVAPCLMVGLGFGRVGCFMNGCCEGAECSTLPAPIAIEFPYATNPYIRHFDQRSLEPSQLPPEEAIRRGPRGEPIAPLTKSDITAKYAQAPAERDKLLTAVAPLHSNRVFNAQLASTVTAFLIAFFLVAFYALPHAPGRVFALMLIIEAPSRFILEMMRAEPAFVGPGSPDKTLAFLPFDLSFSMFVSVWLTLVGVILWFAFKGKPDDMTEPKELPAGRVAIA